ncbi:hypothetical protein [Candidatus Burkholderia verschuerenii]|uniref:hypothetical protein n=1 Tax=Candidatus Burkholderia verschuerenii TaxID=242163 RepID=UPI000AC62D69|nr:hypothetical protein [Candidatus Burkholderia verschuerenii]
MKDDHTPRRLGRRGFLKAGAAAGFASTAGVAHAALTRARQTTRSGRPSRSTACIRRAS